MSSESYEFLLGEMDEGKALTRHKCTLPQPHLAVYQKVCNAPRETVSLGIQVSADQSKLPVMTLSNHKVTFVFAEYTLLILTPAKKAPPPKDLTVSLPMKILSCRFLYFGVPVTNLTGMTICYSSALLFWPTGPYEKTF